MAVKIRLRRVGRKGEPKYQIVAIEAGHKRDGKYLERIGFYDPLPNPYILKLDQQKLEKWLKKGAQPSAGLRKLLKSWKNF
jgi:small subunit ribosomal protein S16